MEQAYSTCVVASLLLGVNSSFKSQQLRVLNREWGDPLQDEPGWHLSLPPGKATHSLQLSVISLCSHWGHFLFFLHECVNQHEGIEHCLISMFTQEIPPLVSWQFLLCHVSKLTGCSPCYHFILFVLKKLKNQTLHKICIYIMYIWYIYQISNAYSSRFRLNIEAFNVSLPSVCAIVVQTWFFLIIFSCIALAYYSGCL